MSPLRGGTKRVSTLSGTPLEDPRILEELETLHRQDFHYETGQILGSMCTAPHPLAVQAALLFQGANLGDPGHFPGAAEIERRYLRGLLGLAGATAGTGGGQGTSGGSEANILALALLRETTGRNEVIVPATGHFSLEKAAKLMKMRLRIADVDARYRVDTKSVASLIGPKTAGILAIAGSTQVGSIDPIDELSKLAQAHHVGLHVDAAFGGYVLPFRTPKRRFGFDLPGVTSVTMDSHKMGMSTLGAGALLVRDASSLEEISVETPYLSMPRQRGVLGTRSGAPVAGAWALLESLGQPGYKAIVDTCMETTRHLVEGLAAQDLHPLVTPELNIVALPVPDPDRVQADLTKRGWRVNVLPRLKALRLVCMPHVTPEVVDAFLPDLATVLGGAPRARHVATPAR